MKLKFLILLSILFAHTISAQLAITPGAQFSVSGFMQLTLHNTDLVNNGTLTPGNSRVSFTGNISSSISGSSPIQFFDLESKKDNNTSIILQRAIGVTGGIFFSSGFLNLNGFNTDLGTTGHLDGENENTRIIGPNGGEVLFNVSLNSPTGSNPANLRIFITSDQDLGNVIIKRGHKSQVNNPGSGNSVFRYYDILPANNTNLNATLRFNYFDGELNGLNENAITLFESTNTVNWTNLGITARDIVANFVEKNSINSFGRFTLFGLNAPLPVRFTLFNAKCDGNTVFISWKTAQEQNASHFDIERSVDGSRWTVIGNLPATGNSATESSYSFTDNTPLQNAYYRIAQYDLDGRPQYTSLLRSSCDRAGLFNVWPNPFTDKLFINITAGASSQVMIKLIDSKGALVKEHRAAVLPGGNQLSIDMKSMPNGVYSLTVYSNNGQTKQTVQVLKQ